MRRRAKEASACLPAAPVVQPLHHAPGDCIRHRTSDGVDILPRRSSTGSVGGHDISRFHSLHNGRTSATFRLVRVHRRIGEARREAAGEIGKEIAGDLVGKAAKPLTDKAISFLSGLLSGDTKAAIKGISKDDYMDLA